MLLLRTYHGLSEPYFADDLFLLNHTGVAAPGLHCNIGGRIHVFLHKEMARCMVGYMFLIVRREGS